MSDSKTKNLFKELVENTYVEEFNYRGKFDIRLTLKPDKVIATDEKLLTGGDVNEIAGVLAKCVDSWELKRTGDEEFTPMNNGYAPSVEFFTEQDFPLPLLGEISTKLLKVSQDTTGKKK